MTLRTPTMAEQHRHLGGELCCAGGAFLLECGAIFNNCTLRGLVHATTKSVVKPVSHRIQLGFLQGKPWDFPLAYQQVIQDNTHVVVYGKGLAGSLLYSPAVRASCESCTMVTKSSEFNTKSLCVSCLIILQVDLVISRPIITIAPSYVYATIATNIRCTVLY